MGPARGADFSALMAEDGGCSLQAKDSLHSGTKRIATLTFASLFRSLSCPISRRSFSDSLLILSRSWFCSLSCFNCNSQGGGRRVQDGRRRAFNPGFNLLLLVFPQRGYPIQPDRGPKPRASLALFTSENPSDPSISAFLAAPTAFNKEPPQSARLVRITA
jgi:hypothetical protein